MIGFRHILAKFNPSYPKKNLFHENFSQLAENLCPI